MNSKQRKQAEHMKNAALAKIAKEGNIFLDRIEVLKLEAAALEENIAVLRKKREILREVDERLRKFDESIQDVLMLLELDEEPAEIARQVRDKYGLLGEW